LEVAVGSLFARCRIGCQIAMLGMIGILGMLAIAAINTWGGSQIDQANAVSSEARQWRDLETQVQIALLQARRHEKNFLLRHDDESVAAQQRATTNALRSLETLAASVATDPGLLDAARQMTGDTQQYASVFDTVVRQGRAIGLNQNLGLLGSLRANVHEVEDNLKSVDSPEAQIAMLTMRRHEKDFIARLDPHYAADLKATAPRFAAAIAAARLPPEREQRLIAQMAAYQDTFARFMTATLEQGESLNKLATLYRGVEPRLADADRQFLARAEAADQLARAIAASTHKNVLLALAGIVLVVVGLSWVIGRNIARPIIAVTRSMDGLVRGDLATPIPTDQRRDEIGTMIQVVGAFRDSLVAAEQLRQDQDAARGQAERDKRAALQHMASRIEQDCSAAVQQIAERTVAMTATAGQMQALSGRTGESAASAAAAAGVALDTAQTVASAAEQLSASIREISSQVGQSTVVVGHAVQAGSDTRATIEALNQQVGRIGTVADTIGDIAARTNLLALNATIEAARAGDAGKGFAVVAGEVKQLANQTARSTEEITRRVNEVQAATSAAVAAVQRIETTIGAVNAIASAIAAAVEEQGAATAEIARNVTGTAAAVNEMTSRNADVSNEAEQAGRHAGDVLASTKVLENAVHDLRQAIVRTVRTSTEEVDRRLFKRVPSDLLCTIEVAGHPQRVHIADISEGGARLIGATQLPAGGTGTVRINGVQAALPVAILAVDEESVRIAFKADKAGQREIQALIERIAHPLAA
jgi:methyl-accepting chemotaxis protein